MRRITKITGRSGRHADHPRRERVPDADRGADLQDAQAGAPVPARGRQEGPHGFAHGQGRDQPGGRCRAPSGAEGGAGRNDPPHQGAVGVSQGHRRRAVLDRAGDRRQGQRVIDRRPRTKKSRGWRYRPATTEIHEEQISQHAHSEIVGMLPEGNWITAPRASSARPSCSPRCRTRAATASTSTPPPKRSAAPAATRCRRPLLSGKAKYSSIFNYPTLNWADIGVIGWLVDGAAIMNQDPAVPLQLRAPTRAP